MIDFACKEFKLDEIIKCGLGLTKSEYKIFELMLGRDEKLCSTQKIADRLKLDVTTVQRSVKKLHEKGIFMRKQENLDGGGYTYHYHIKEKREIRKIIQQIIHTWTSKVDAELEKW